MSDKPRYTPESMADRLMAKTAGYLRNGFPPSYEKPTDYIYDFWPDLPWDAPGQVEAVKHILANYPDTLRLFQTVTGHDLKADMERIVHDSL